MAALNTVRSVYRASTDTNLPRAVDKEMRELEPDFAPLYVLTNAAGNKEGTPNPKFEWFEDQEVPLLGTVSNGTTDYSSVATSIVVADATIFGPGDLCAVLKANSSAAAEEVILVTAGGGAAGATLTVTRNIGGAGADTIGATNTLYIIGSAHVEDGAVSSQRYMAATPKASYIQIFKDAIKHTDLSDATERYVKSNDTDYQTYKAMKTHRSRIELSGLLGRGSQTLADPSSRWTTQGVKPTIATNVTSGGTSIDFNTFLTFGQTAFRYGSKEKLGIFAPVLMSAVGFYSANKLQTHVGDKEFGVSIKQLILPHGIINLANDWRFTDGGFGGAGLNDEGFVLDLAAIKMRYQNGNGMSLDTKVYRDVVKDGSTQTVDEIRSYVGWQVMNEQKHARIYNASNYK